MKSNKEEGEQLYKRERPSVLGSPLFGFSAWAIFRASAKQHILRKTTETRNSASVAFLPCLSASGPPSFRAERDRGVSAVMQAAKTGSAPVSGALRLSMRVGNAGISSPHSMRDAVLAVVPDLSAKSSCVMPRSLRMRRIACPPRLKSLLITILSVFLMGLLPDSA